MMARVRAEDYDDKREAILLRAAHVFAHAGTERASMSGVADACGISKALLYHYYDSKDALIYDIISTHLAGIEAALAEAPRDGDPESNVRNLCRALLAQYENADDLHRVQMNSLESLPEGQAAEIRESERRIVAIFASAIAALDDRLAGNRRLLIPVTMSLLGMLNWAFMWFRPDRGMTRTEYADLASALTIEGIKKLDLAAS